MATTLVNRLDEKLEVMFDGIPYEFEPYGEVTLPDLVARHLRKRSLIKDNPVTGQGVFALARKGIDPTEPVARDGELLDRTDMEVKKVELVRLNNPVGGRDGGPNSSALDEFGYASEKSEARSKRV